MRFELLPLQAESLSKPTSCRLYEKRCSEKLSVVPKQKKSRLLIIQQPPVDKYCKFRIMSYNSVRYYVGTMGCLQSNEKICWKKTAKD